MTLPTLPVCLQFFDYARKGDVEGFRAPLAAGLPANLTNDNGDTLVSDNASES